MPGVYSVSEVNGLIKSAFAALPALQRIQVRGEISNFKRYDSGHCYFTLKDGKSLLKAVMFRARAALLRFKPENGRMAVASGRIDLYERDGVYQLYVDNLFADGAGDLMAAYEELRRKLQEEGVFDLERKKKLPPFPAAIGVITSSAGAVLHDVITVAGKRNPAVRLVFFPVRVQGAEAPAELAHALYKMNEWKIADVLIIGRGGGSIEELWAFNDERVVRAVAESDLPVVSAVGHETDVTLCDFAADVRAATPSQAAELAVPDRQALLAVIGSQRQRMARVIKARIDKLDAHIRHCLNTRVFRRPETLFAARAQTVDKLYEELRMNMTRKTQSEERNLRALTGKLDSLSPLAVLARGYGVTTDEKGELIKNMDKVACGDMLRTRLHCGEIYSQVRAKKAKAGVGNAQKEERP
ncbi:MAG: exodeoxyribonuclease VII large subunit [Acidaminococcales bacterium]|jgi:exodeoxyribonuclease VII large subunit|nr:exodeoxyribonuclease VII large subunit [Acidaminococcales bacterium]